MRIALTLAATACCVCLAAPAFAEEICNNGNIDAVLNGPQSEATPCSIPSPAHITAITTYHWNSGQGAAPGQIILRNAQTGQEYGPFDAQGTPGQGGVPDAYWTAHVDLNVPAGEYEVLDSDVASWAWNNGSGGQGIITVTGEFTGGPGEGMAPEDNDAGPDPEPQR